MRHYFQAARFSGVVSNLEENEIARAATEVKYEDSAPILRVGGEVKVGEVEQVGEGRDGLVDQLHAARGVHVETRQPSSRQRVVSLGTSEGRRDRQHCGMLSRVKVGSFLGDGRLAQMADQRGPSLRRRVQRFVGPNTGAASAQMRLDRVEDGVKVSPLDVASADRLVGRDRYQRIAWLPRNSCIT